MQVQAHIGSTAAYKLKKELFKLFICSSFHLFLHLLLYFFIHVAICLSVLPSIQEVCMTTCSMPGGMISFGT